MLAGSSGQAGGGYQISRSLRFNSADSAYLNRTPASAGNRKTWTWAGWVKRSGFAAINSLFECRSGSTDSTIFGIQFGEYSTSNDYIAIAQYSQYLIKTNAIFRDPSAWYHVVVALGTTQATASDRIKIFINGVSQSFAVANYPSQNADLGINQAAAHNLGNSNGIYLNGYLADIHFIDGQALTPSSFTETDATTGQLIPKAYSGSYGTNGFRLYFSDNSAATATTLGKDSAGSNNWTPNNLSVTAGAGNDSLVDTPTSYGTDTGVGGEVRGNYATFNPAESSTSGTKTLTNGNLDVLLADANAARLTIPPIQASGKYQWEITIGSKTASYYQMGLNLLSMVYAAGDLHVTFRSDGNRSNTLSGSWSGTGVSYTSGDIITVTYDNATNACSFYKNGVFSATFTVSGTPQASLNFGVFYGGSGNTNYTLNAGQRAFAYPVSGFKALCDTNLPAPVVAKPNTVMDVALWTGNGSARSITGLAFNPDFVWIKGRSGATDHALYDAVRGVQIDLVSNSTAAETTQTQGLTAFNSDGFSLGTLAKVNTSSATYVGWAWDAGTSTVSNTAGSISSQVRANASAGFSVVTYTGTLTSVANNTVGHGLNVAPKLIIYKNRSASANWHVVMPDHMTNTQYLNLNSTSALLSYGVGSLPDPTSSVIYTLYSGEVDVSGNNFVAYCFAPVSGYSSRFSYTGNGSADGVFQFLGFRPRLIMLKRSDNTSNWTLLDTSREGYNVDNDPLYPNLSDAEGTTDLIDITSNGFKLRSTDASVNASAATYIGFAWAENPFQYARAR